jgi:hypothetical protein
MVGHYIVHVEHAARHLENAELHGDVEAFFGKSGSGRRR